MTSYEFWSLKIAITLIVPVYLFRLKFHLMSGFDVSASPEVVIAAKKGIDAAISKTKECISRII